jgi:hypothetical protein
MTRWCFPPSWDRRFERPLHSLRHRLIRGSSLGASNACDGLGPDPRRALGPAAIRAASTGRTHDRTRPSLRREDSPCQLGAVHTCAGFRTPATTI